MMNRTQVKYVRSETAGSNAFSGAFRWNGRKSPEIARKMEAVFPTETHRNFPVIFPPDPAENEMESGRQKSNDFQTGNVSLEKAGYDRFR